MLDEDENEVIARPLTLLLTAVIFAFTAVYMGLKVPGAMRNFREMFAKQGLDADPATRLVLDYPDVWWLFGMLALAVAVWVALRPRAPRADFRKMRFIMGTVIAVTVFAFGFAAFAVYSPLLAPR
jgi:uncharacterized BrkB/YihY/UPF0761 family membrane protein